MHNTIAKNAPDQVREYMAQHGIKQRELAIRAKVSQATVSRALSGKILRRGSARTKLFTFVGISESSGIADPRERVIAVFDKIWNHTEVHADAIARVIDALGEFSPQSQGRSRR